MSDTVDGGRHVGAHVFSFSEKTPRERLREFGKRLYGELGTFLATAVSLWAFAEAIAAAMNGRAPVERLAIPVLFFALAVGMYRAYRKLRDYTPDVLKTESNEVKRIFQKQQCGWNAAIARQMLLDRIRAAEATLERMKSGAEYAQPVEMEEQAYYKWLRSRPSAMMRMSHAVMVLCTREVPSVVGRTASEADLPSLRDEIDALGRVYSAARDMEMDCYRIVPPGKFAAIHDLTVGWTDSIRDGVSQLCGVLEDIAKVDRRSLAAGTATLPTFSIVIGSPPALDEFNERIEAFSG